MIKLKWPSVTILLTVKNSVSTIEECVNFLLRLNYKNYKIYVVDAFSTDGTYESLKKYGKMIKLERWRGNPPTAYNHAIKKINTEFIAFTDADCVADKNWIKNLVLGFESSAVGAVVGFCKTPRNVNFLQKLIGLELENRFKNFPKYISRGPTMNICIRTALAKKFRFDERLDISYDTDFGYRLTENGKKIIYNPNAVIYHYHRASWRKLFKQQLIYGRFLPLLYKKHMGKVTGDHISTPSMMVQPFIFGLIILFIFLSVLSNFYTNVAVVLSAILFLIYLSDFLKLKTKLEFLPAFMLIFLVRTLALSLGALMGIKRIFE